MGARKGGLRRSLGLASLLMVLLALAACGVQTPEAEGLSTQAVTTYYVATNGVDGSNPGTSSSAPLATISNAINKAQSSRSQGAVDIVIAPGTYRQAVIDNDPSTGPLITVKGAGAIVSGSDIYTNWSPTSSGGATHIHSWGFTWGEETPDKPEHDPMITRRECVFNNGQLLTQVKRGATLTANTFKVDEPYGNLYIDVPSLGTVEVCVRETLWKLPKTRNLLVEGLTFQHAASRWKQPAVFAYSGQTYNGITVRYNGQAGVQLTGQPWLDVSVAPGYNIIIRNSYLNNNGFSGLTDEPVRDGLVEDGEINFNNWRGDWWGHYGWDTGNKTLGVRRLVLRRNQIEGNRSPGWWCDTDCMDIEIYDNTFKNNTAGMNLELSQGPFEVYRNTFVGNTGYDLNCDSVDKCHVRDNSMSGIFKVKLDSRCIVATADGPHRGNYPNNTRTWFNPFNLTQDYYPSLSGFDIQRNTYKQLVFEYVEPNTELQVMRNEVVNWKDNNPPGGAHDTLKADKVKVVLNSGTTTHSEAEFRAQYFDPDWLNFN